MNSDGIAVGILKAATVIAIVAGITWLFYSERPWLAVLLGAVALVWPALWSQLKEGDVAGFVQTSLAIAFLAGLGVAGWGIYSYMNDGNSAAAGRLCSAAGSWQPHLAQFLVC
jgi:hypothetical protein